MPTVAEADKSRLTIRGLVDGRHYMAREQPGGWYITPQKMHRVKKTGMSAAAFARLYRARAPLGADTAGEISANTADGECGEKREGALSLLFLTEL